MNKAMEKLHEIHEKCKGCNHVVANTNGTEVCSTYVNPTYWWEVFGGGACPCATHLTKEQLAEIRKTNPIKKSKRLDSKPYLRQGGKSAGKWPSSGVKTPKRFATRKGR